MENLHQNGYIKNINNFMKVKLQFLELCESLRAQGSPTGSVLKDVQVGDTYLWLVKNGNTYSIKKGKGPNANDVKFTTVFSGSEEAATKKFNKLWRSSVTKV